MITNYLEEPFYMANDNLKFLVELLIELVMLMVIVTSPVWILLLMGLTEYSQVGLILSFAIGIALLVYEELRYTSS